LCIFLWAKGLNDKDIHNEMFPVYGESGLQLGGKRLTDDEEAEMEVQKWLRQQSKGFYDLGFDAL
jgi:hypothetical protein